MAKREEKERGRRERQRKEREREVGSGWEHAGAVGLQPLASDRNWSVNSSHWLSL